MEEKRLLRRLRRGDTAALKEIILRYTPYVSAVIRNQLGGLCQTEDVEELCANVFFALWRQRDTLKTDHLRGWLGTVARNQARDLLRRLPPTSAAEEDTILISGDDLEDEALRKEQSRLVREAVFAMGQPDREIFLRHYFYNQKCREIAGVLNMSEEAVKGRLKRGRTKLRETILRGGYFCEMED